MSEEGFRVDREKPKTISMSFLRSANECMLRAVKDREASIGGIPATIGHVFHDAAAAIGTATVMAGRTMPEKDRVEWITRQVIETPEKFAPLPKEDWQTAINLVTRWAETVEFSLNAQFEIGSRQLIAGRLHTARLDVVTADENDRVVYIDDWKTGRALPSGKDRGYQGEVYCWHASKMFPTAERFVFREHFVRLNRSLEPIEFSRLDLVQTEEWLYDQACRIDRAYESDDFPATPGPCPNCVAKLICPIPEFARPASLINTPEEAKREFEVLLVEEERVKERKKNLKAYLTETEAEKVSANGKKIAFVTKDRKSLDAKLAKEAGIDLDEFRVTKPSTTFSITKDEGGE